MKWIVRLCAGIGIFVLFASAATAQDGMYLRLGGGASLENSGLNETEDLVVGPTVFELDYLIEFDTGPTATAAVGYNFFTPLTMADVRLELEGSYRSNEADRITGSGVPTTSISSGVDSEAYGAFVNAYFDLRTVLRLDPYIGVGLGGVHVSYDVPGGIDDDDIAFAHQLIGGINYFFSDTLALGLEYRFLQSETLDLGDTGFDPVYKHQSVLLNLTIGF